MARRADRSCGLPACCACGRGSLYLQVDSAAATTTLPCNCMQLSFCCIGLSPSIPKCTTAGSISHGPQALAGAPAGGRQLFVGVHHGPSGCGPPWRHSGRCRCCVPCPLKLHASLHASTIDFVSHRDATKMTQFTLGSADEMGLGCANILHVVLCSLDYKTTFCSEESRAHLNHMCPLEPEFQSWR